MKRSLIKNKLFFLIAIPSFDILKLLKFHYNWNANYFMVI